MAYSNLILLHQKFISNTVESEKGKKTQIEVETKRYSPNTKQVKKIATLKVIFLAQKVKVVCS